MFQECHRLAGVLTAYPASLKPPDPCRNPGPGRVDHLHDHTPVTLCDHPATRAARQLVARLNIEHQGPWGASHAHQMEALQPDEQITSITTIKRRTAAAGRVRHCRGPLKIAGVEVRSSSRTSTSTRNPRSTPGHPHSTRKSLQTPTRRRFRIPKPHQLHHPSAPRDRRIQTPTTLQLQRAGFHVEGQRFEPGRAHKTAGAGSESFRPPGVPVYVTRRLSHPPAEPAPAGLPRGSRAPSR